MPHEQLQRALAILMSDEEYRGAIAGDPNRLELELGVRAGDLDILTYAGGSGQGASHAGTRPGHVGGCTPSRVGGREPGARHAERVGRCVEARHAAHVGWCTEARVGSCDARVGPCPPSVRKHRSP